MEALPDYVLVTYPDWSEGIDPAVERIEMERGPALQAIRNTHVFKQVRATFLFRTAADAVAFEDWYFDALGRVDWFTMRHRLSGATIQARFVGGDIGALVPTADDFSQSKRSVTLEFMR